LVQARRALGFLFRLEPGKLMTVTRALALLLNALPASFCFCFPDAVVVEALELLRAEVLFLEEEAERLSALVQQVR
jgi:hypothetical protein